MTEPPRPWFTYFIPPPALAIAFVVIGLFAYAFSQNSENEMLVGALISAFTGAVGYYLGSSKGAAENRDQLNKHADKLLEAAPSNGKVSLAAGESVKVEAGADGEEPPWAR